MHTTAPNNKIQGQLWYDQTNKQLNVYTGTKFKPVGSTTNSASAPVNAVQGDLWFDTTNTQLYVYTGTDWTLVGPTTVAGSGVTQFTTDSVQDNTGVNRSILKMITNDTVVAIVSNIAFTPSSTAATGSALITAGFATVAQGLTLSTAVASNKVRGTATDADALGVIAAANYLRSNAKDTTTGKITIQNDDGLAIGAGQDITMSLSSDNLTIAQTTQDKDIIFTTNTGGTTTTLATFDGSTGRLELPSGVDVEIKV